MKGLLQWLNRAWARASGRVRRPRALRAVHVEELPDRLENRFIYLVGGKDRTWCVALLCPCGCGATVQLNTLAGVRPCWSVSEHPDRSVSLHPSVWRQVGCHSHFFVRRGLIEWCGI